MTTVTPSGIFTVRGKHIRPFLEGSMCRRVRRGPVAAEIAPVERGVYWREFSVPYLLPQFSFFDGTQWLLGLSTNNHKDLAKQIPSSWQREGFVWFGVTRR